MSCQKLTAYALRPLPCLMEKRKTILSAEKADLAAVPGNLLALLCSIGQQASCHILLQLLVADALKQGVGIQLSLDAVHASVVKQVLLHHLEGP